MEQRTIRELRTAAGLTQRQLAEKLGVWPNSVSRWELDQTRITAEQLQALTVILDTPAAAIRLPNPENGSRPTGD